MLSGFIIIAEGGPRTTIPASGETLHHAHRLLQNQTGPNLSAQRARGRPGRRTRSALIDVQDINIIISSGIMGE